ncbi:hypothetical protein AZE42_12350 [Rhizopogon vesiculosus]|uniref:F-box domain-containing protein n=1 Tax=Rhizopogon vesiculosus TaxID=180088 RepID=A0A1J8QPA9_9AGAM|nr:hypothetical protein AZE42_12350 [Rhizopogon vesiculosus]
MRFAIQILVLGHIDDVQIPDLETPYSRYSNTNLSVIGQDQSIHAVTTERQQQSDAVLHQIQDLDAVTKTLHQHLVEKQDNITQSMNLHKRLVSALWRLPTEVLCQIFVHCLPETDYPTASSRLAPMVLTRICRRWREIVVGMPNLWCRLSVDFLLHRRRRWQQLVLCYDLWLKRSQGCPLSLTILFDRDVIKVRSLSQPYMNQISSIISNTDACRLLALNLPILQELTIQYLSTYSTADERSILHLPCTPA